MLLPLGVSRAHVGADYRWRRLLAFLNPWADPLGDGFQIIQSLIAVGTGGVFGRGLMGGMQKLFYLPEPHTDFIFAVIAEELGLIGATLVVVCFGVIAWRGLRAATTAPDRFGAFLALGITTMVVVQAFVNISVVLGLLPTKGIPLPLVSTGGSSLLVNLVAHRRAAEHLAACGARWGRRGARSRVTGASPHCRRRHRGTSLPGDCRGRRAGATDPARVVSFVGTARGLESRVVPALGYPLDLIRSAGLKGKSLSALVRGLSLLPLSALDAWQVLSRRHPDVVVGVGGYSSGPVLLLAALRGIPTLLMEQNTAPGFTNRRLARWVRAAAVSYDETLEFFPGTASCRAIPCGASSCSPRRRPVRLRPRKVRCAC